MKIKNQTHEKIPWRSEATAKELQKSFNCGDVLAPLQALKFVTAGLAPMPDWVKRALAEPYSELLMGTRKGKTGKGNSAFGGLRKQFTRTVRASSYRYVRAWQRNPHLYYWMPRQTIELWFEGEIQWQSGGYSDALRYANTGLKGTNFSAQSQTIRRNATGFVPPVPWSRLEVEFDLGLRGGGSGLFGPSSTRVPPKIEAFLKKYEPLVPLLFLPGRK